MGTNVKRRKQHSTLVEGQNTDQHYLRLRQNAFLAVKEAKKRRDQSFLDELSAYAESKTDLPAAFLPGQGRGRKVTDKGDIIALLGKVELRPNGKIKNIKSAVEMPATTKQCHWELVRFCKNLVRDLENDPSPTFSKYGFRQGQLPLFQKARRIGMHYAGNSTHAGRAHQACSPVKLRDN